MQVSISHFRLTDIGWHQTKINNNTKLTDFQVSAYPKKGFSSNLISPTSCHISQKLTTISTYELVNQYRKAVNHQNLVIKEKMVKHMMPNHFLYFPKISHLLGKGRAMNGQQSGKPIPIMTPIKILKALVYINSSE